MAKSPTTPRKPLLVDLGLQGGDSHGAFTWGGLDRLLGESRLEIEGDGYWDGGFAGNPTMTPLIRECASDDTILIGINPVERPGTPETARDILNRLNEVSCNAVLPEEREMMALLRRGATTGDAEAKHWAQMHLHLVRSDLLTGLGASFKVDAEWSFLTMLRDEGRRAAEVFLAEKGEQLGRNATLDIDRLLECV